MKSIFISSIIWKCLMGLSGLGLIIFVLVHMMGNLLIFAGAKAYNLYAHQMTQNWIIVLELGLVFLFLFHIVLAVFLSLKNIFASGKNYAYKAKGEKATALYQKTLLAQGAVILAFVIVHLITFKFGTHYEVNYGEKTVRDLFRLVVEVFQNPLVIAWYLVALGVLFFHLLHGLESAFKSLGVGESTAGGMWINRLSKAYAGFVIAGYMAQPLYVFCYF